METMTAACNAMATRFEMVLHGENPIALRAAADAAIREIERLHGQLSLYLPSSELSYINRHASREAVQVEPGLFSLLRLAQTIHGETGGVFDITIAPLIRCWGFMGGSGSLPNAEQVAEARSKVGMQHVILDERRRTVRFAKEGMMIDLGSIGKGYALEAACETLTEAGIESALVHGGTSTVYALGASPGQDGWKVAVETPPILGASEGTGEPQAAPAGPSLAVVTLKNESLSVSAVHGKAFQAHGKTYGHVIDPGTGMPTQGALLAAVVLPGAAESDAFSTALLVLGVSGLDTIAGLRSGVRALVAEADLATGRLQVAASGIAALLPK